MMTDASAVNRGERRTSCVGSSPIDLRCCLPLTFVKVVPANRHAFAGTVFARSEVIEHEFGIFGREHAAGRCPDASTGSRDDHDSAVERPHDVVVR